MASDDFNRADGGLGANWVRVNGTALAIVSNRVESVAANAGIMKYDTGTWADNQESQVTMVSAPSGKACGPAVRLSGTDGTSVGYVFVTDHVSYTYLMTLDNGVLNAMGAGLATPAAGSVLKITASGTTIEAFDDGVSLGTRTNASYTSGKPGIYGEGAGTVIQLDDWSGVGDSGGGSGHYGRLAGESQGLAG